MGLLKTLPVLPHRHTVQFFDVESALVQSVAQFLREGLSAGDAVVVVTDPDRRNAFVASLERLRSDPDSGFEDGRLVIFDGDTLLSKFYRSGKIDANGFDAVVGTALRAVASRSRSRNMCVYGDMVGSLWARGERTAAIDLERCWNDLQAQLPFRLYCAYPIDPFGEEFRAETLEPILEKHSGVEPSYSPNEMRNALDFAMYETLGPAMPPPSAAAPNTTATLPEPETTILWLRANAPQNATAILARARAYIGAETITDVST